MLQRQCRLAARLAAALTPPPLPPLPPTEAMRLQLLRHPNVVSARLPCRPLCACYALLWQSRC